MQHEGAEPIRRLLKGLRNLPGPRAWPWLVLSALILFVYRALGSWKPEAEVPRQSQSEAEGLFFEPSAGTPVLIFSVAAWMLWRRRNRLAAVVGNPSWTPAAALLLPSALLLAAWAHYVGATDLLIPSLQLLMLGSGALLGGAQGARVVLVPALFLVFAIPIPSVILNQILFPMQLVTAQLTQGTLLLLGVPSQLSGDQIFTTDRVFHVIETCSGLRLVETLTMAAVVYAELLHRGWLHTLFLVVAAPCIGIVINTARVLSIVFNPYSEFAAVHTTQGLAMLVVGVCLVAGVDRLLEGLRAPPAREPSRSRPGPLGLPTGRYLALCASLLGAAGATVFLPPWSDGKRGGYPSIYSIPSELGGWTAGVIDVDESFLGSVVFTQRFYRRYEHDGQRFDLFLGVDDRLSRRVSPISPKTRLPGGGWEIEDHSVVPLGADGKQADLLVLRSPRSRALALHWRLGIEGLGTETFRSFLGLDRSPLRRRGRAAVVRISTPLATDADLATAAARVKSFATHVEEYLPALLSESR